MRAAVLRFLTFMKIILCRHGQTTHNVANICSGCNDIGISETGIRQAHAIGSTLKKFGVTKLFCSDLRRAVETALIVSRYTLCDPIIRSELRERSFGIFEGRLGEDLRADLAVSGLSPETYRPNGGENYYDVLERAKLFRDFLSKEGTGGIIGVIAHGNFNCAFLTLWTGGSPCDLKQDQACINIVEDAFGNAARVSLLNSVDHIADSTENKTEQKTYSI